MLYDITGDLVESNIEIICHQTNCRGVMGSGIAKQIKDKYPIVQERNFEYYKYGDNILGTNLYIKLPDNRYCVNMYAQDGYGRDSRQYTDYKAFQECLWRLEKKLAHSALLRVGFPYKIGCGLGGGDWQIVRKMIENFAGRVTQDVYIVRKDNV